MQESKDPAIKLFGKKIPLQGEGDDATISGDDSVSLVAIDVEKEGGGRGGGGDDSGLKRADAEGDEADKESQSGKVTESCKEKEGEHLKDASAKNDNGNKSPEKTLKNPDKVLPCPRCNSMDTKFCYYNNYNINQPRHFCKSCQRYWTAGGTMRNVPVGAGRRKNKNNSSHYRQITISEALHAAMIDAANGTNGKILSFGLDSPICASMASALNLAESNIDSESTRNGFHNHMLENQRSTSSMKESGKNNLQIPCLPGVPWPYPPPPGFPLLSFHHPSAFWNYCVSGDWNVNLPCFSSNSSLPTLKSPKSGPSSPTLGKHNRDGDMSESGYLQKEPSKQRNGSVLVPKTLRIDDPREAAKSSIWATLGLTNKSLSGGGIFEAFQSKKDEKNQKHHGHGVEASSVLRANPAALSRSINFHENT